MLCHEHDPDPEARTDPKGLENREDVITMMIAGLSHIYRYFEPHRREERMQACRKRRG